VSNRSFYLKNYVNYMNSKEFLMILKKYNFIVTDNSLHHFKDRFRPSIIIIILHYLFGINRVGGVCFSGFKM
jgi:hypothetical protein